MDLRHLRYFVAVAEEGHFGRAAERLHIVQPALSMQIKALEDELGGPLFIRTSRQVRMTEAGELLLVEARHALAQAERAKEIVQSSLRGNIGTVRIGFVGNAVLTGKLASDLRRFRATFPSAVVTLHEMPPHQQSEELIAKEIDLGYCPKGGFVSRPELQAHPVFTSPFVAVMATDHELAGKTSLTLRMLEKQTLILLGVEAREGPLDLLKRMGFASKSLLRVSSTLSVLASAAAGMGIALVPSSIQRLQIPHLEYRPVKGLTTKSTLMLVSRLDETAGAVREFLKVAKT